MRLGLAYVRTGLHNQWMLRFKAPSLLVLTLPLNAAALYGQTDALRPPAVEFGYVHNTFHDGSLPQLRSGSGAFFAVTVQTTPVLRWRTVVEASLHREDPVPHNVAGFTPPIRRDGVNHDYLRVSFGPSTVISFDNAPISIRPGAELSWFRRFGPAPAYGGDVGGTLGIMVRLSDRWSLFAEHRRAFMWHGWSKLFDAPPGNVASSVGGLSAFRLGVRR